MSGRRGQAGGVVSLKVNQPLAVFGHWLTKSGLASGYFLAMTAMAFAIGKMVIA